MQRASKDENGRKQARTIAESTEQAGVSTPETQQHRRKAVGCLLQVYALQLMLFGLLAWFVHVHPILPLDVAITRSFQQNQAPWLRITMLAISYPGSSLLLPVLVLLTAVFFWAVGLRLDAVLVGGLSTVSLLLNLLLKVQVSRPRPTANLVHIIRWLSLKTPATSRGTITFLLRTLDQSLGGYFRGTLLLALIGALCTGVVLALLHVPYAALLAMLFFLLSFIPVIGTYVIAALCILAALPQGWVVMLIVAIFMVLLLGIVMGQILAPRIFSRAVGVHPIVAIFALFAGAELFGLGYECTRALHSRVDSVPFVITWLGTLRYTGQRGIAG